MANVLAVLACVFHFSPKLYICQMYLVIVGQSKVLHEFATHN